jgi:hypothetical protein
MPLTMPFSSILYSLRDAQGRSKEKRNGAATAATALQYATQSQRVLSCMS